MPEDPNDLSAAFDQVSFGDKIAQRRAERASRQDERTEHPDPRIEALLARVTALENLLANLQGANGITIALPVIGFIQPAGTINIICDPGGATMSGTITF